MIRNVNLEVLVILAILFLLFGTTRLRDIGSNLSAGVRSFRKGLQQDEESKS